MFELLEEDATTVALAETDSPTIAPIEPVAEDDAAGVDDDEGDDDDAVS